MLLKLFYVQMVLMAGHLQLRLFEQRNNFRLSYAKEDDALMTLLQTTYKYD